VLTDDVTTTDVSWLYIHTVLTDDVTMADVSKLMVRFIGQTEQQSDL